MATGVKTRVKLPKEVRAGDVTTIKTLITHQMESGQRSDAQGVPIPQSIINRFLCTFDGETVQGYRMNGELWFALIFYL